MPTRVSRRVSWRFPKRVGDIGRPDSLGEHFFKLGICKLALSDLEFSFSPGDGISGFGGEVIGIWSSERAASRGLDGGGRSLTSLA